MGLLINFDHFEATKSDFMKITGHRPQKSKFEKEWFGRKENNSTLRVGKKQGVAKPFGMSLGHFLELSRLSYLI